MKLSKARMYAQMKWLVVNLETFVFGIDDNVCVSRLELKCTGVLYLPGPWRRAMVGIRGADAGHTKHLHFSTSLKSHWKIALARLFADKSGWRCADRQRQPDDNIGSRGVWSHFLMSNCASLHVSHVSQKTCWHKLLCGIVLLGNISTGHHIGRGWGNDWYNVLLHLLDPNPGTFHQFS